MSDRRTVTNYFQQARYARAMMLAGLAATGALTLTGCDTGPACIDSHVETQWVSVFNGKTATMQPVVVTVCDRYEKEKANG
ncbi:hypothetical protein [Streptomyces platensis]|uniref:hypothetical protein n=1 Tax=Streptomyces platensis TaxID=58346 RepID=UPI002E263A11